MWAGCSAAERNKIGAAAANPDYPAHGSNLHVLRIHRLPDFYVCTIGAREASAAPDRQRHTVADPVRPRSHLATRNEPGAAVSACSAGILLFRLSPAGAQVLLGHPGGPLWRRKDAGAWSIPKGLCREGEAPLLAAQREFREETGFDPSGALLELGSVRQTSAKRVHVWALAGDADPEQMVSNSFPLEWPPRSGRVQHYPELDRVAWFDLPTARCKILKAQAPFIERLERLLQEQG